MRRETKGLLITCAGVAAICPDVLFVRLIAADPMTLVFWRGLLSFLGIGAALWLLDPRGVGRSFRQIGWHGWLLAVAWSVGSFFFILSISLTSAANTLFINSTAPLFAAVIAKLLGDAVPWRTWLAIAAAMVGIGVIASGSLTGQGGSIWGDVAALGSALSAAITFVIANRRHEVSMVPAMALAGLLTAVAALPLAAPLAISPQAWGYVLAMGLICVSLGFGLLTLGARYLPAPEVSLLILGEAVVGPLLVWWFLGENPGQRSLLGGAIVLAALVTLNLAQLFWRGGTRR